MTKIIKLPKSQIEVEGELAPEVLEGYYPLALKHVSENMEVPGFRKGKVPENVVLSNVSEMRLLEEMAELALGEHYPKILEAEKIDAVGKPEITITKLARNNPLGFKIKTAILPEIELGDYKKHAKKAGEESKKEKIVEVTEEDLENTIMDIRKSRAPHKHPAEMAEGGEPEPAKEELPELNDEFVRSLGPFENVADFKEKLRENLKLEKENQAREKKRIKIMEKILSEAKGDIPDLLIDLELDKILYRMESDIAQMGLKFEDYLTHMKKSKEDLRKDFRGEAEKKAKLALVLSEIAKLEKIVADEELVEKEVATILEQYKDADPERARAYAENVLTNEKIFEFLENL